MEEAEADLDSVFSLFLDVFSVSHSVILAGPRLCDMIEEDDGRKLTWAHVRPLPLGGSLSSSRKLSFPLSITAGSSLGEEPFQSAHCLCISSQARLGFPA